MAATNIQSFSGDIEVASNVTTSNINVTGTIKQNGSVLQGSQWTTNGDDVVYTAGNIGIGTDSPTSNLHVNGEVSLEKIVTLPDPSDHIYLIDRRNGSTDLSCEQGVSNNEINNVTLASNAFIFQGALTSNITTPELGLSGDPQISASMWLYLENKLNANILTFGGLPLIDMTGSGQLQGYKQTSTLPIDYKKWNHIVYTYGGESNSTSFYLNTKLSISDAISYSSTLPESAGTLSFGTTYLSYAYDNYQLSTELNVSMSSGSPFDYDIFAGGSSSYELYFDYSNSGVYSGGDYLGAFDGQWVAFTRQDGELMKPSTMYLNPFSITAVDILFRIIGSTSSSPSQGSFDWTELYSGTIPGNSNTLQTFNINSSSSYEWLAIVFTQGGRYSKVNSLSFEMAGDPPSFVTSNVAILGSNTLASVANFRIYDRVLNPLEIEQLYEYDEERFEGIPLGNVTYNKSLGIQNKSPVYNLDVTGDINVSSNVYHDSSVLMYKTGNFIHKQVGGNIVGDSQGYNGSSVSVSRDGSVIALGSNAASEVGIYEWTGYKWLQRGSRITGEATTDNFGASVSISSDGSRVAIGAPNNGGNGVDAGHVRVYEWSTSNFTWTQMGSDIDGESAGDQSGTSVILNEDGTKVAIGAPYNDANGSNSGQTRVYQWSGSAWSQVGSDIDGNSGDRLGTSVSFDKSGFTLAVGLPGNGGGTDTGGVRVYELSGSAWNLLGSELEGAAGDLLGTSVSISGDALTLAAGAPGNNAGHVRVYDLRNSSWVSSGYLSGEISGDNFGTSVNLSDDGTRLIAGAPDNDGTGSNSGHARIYNRSHINGWTQIDKDIDGIAANDNFGTSVSISGDGNLAIIGAKGYESYNGLAQAYKITKPTHVAEDIVVDNTLNTKDMNLSNTFFVNNRAIFRGDCTFVKMGSDIDGEAANDTSGFSVSLSNDGTRVAIGARYNDGTGSNAGHTRVYSWSGSAWTQLGSDIDGEAAGDESGYSVSISGDGTRVAVGARLNDGSGSSAGHTRVYSWSGSAWTQLGSDIDGEAASDQSGYSVSLSNDGTRVAIGALANDGTGSNAGHTRVYEWSGSAWTQVGSDIDGEDAGDNSGTSVSISGDGTRVAIGAPYNDGSASNAGHARVYEWSGSAWTQMGSDIDGNAANDNSGLSVSLSNDGTRVAVGTPYSDEIGSSAGSVRVYEWSGSTWTQMGSDMYGEAAGDNLGFSVSLSNDGTRVAAGAQYNDGSASNAGHTRVYEWSGSAWTQIGSDIDGEAASDQSGYSVSISGDGSRVAIGARYNDGSASNAGHTRVYDIIESLNALGGIRGSENVVIGPNNGHWWRLYTFQHNGNLGFLGEDGVEHGYLVDSGTVANIDFTGQHRAIVDKINTSDYESLEGLIVSANKNKYVNVDKDVTTGSNAIQISQALPIVSLSNVVHDKACYGVIAGSEDPDSRKYEQGTFVSVFQKQEGDTRAFINSVGEGAIWVVNSNGSLESGDYITTSNITGYGQKQNDDILHNYTVAKITMDCDFNPATQPVQRILRSNVVNTYYLANVHQVKSVPYEVVTTTVTADDTWSNVSIYPPRVTYEEWSNLDANVQSRFTLTYTQTSNVVYDVKYTHTTTGDDKTPDEWSALESNVQSLYSKVYYQSVEQEVAEDYPGAVAHTRVTNLTEIELDEYGKVQWEDHPTETEKAYKIRYLDANGVETDEASHVYKAAFVGCTYHCG
jgi:hypothetical protein